MIPELRSLEIRHVILSRSRPRAITTHRLFPKATLVVPESQIADYAHLGLETVGIPDERTGVSAVHNWICDHFTEECLCMMCDDLTACICNVSLRSRRLSVEEIEAVVDNTAHCALGAGARIFGFHQNANPINLQRNDPFGVSHWIGGFFGLIGRPVRWDEMLKCKCDIDACLQELMENRIIWTDARFFFEHNRDHALGGNSLFKSSDRVAAEKRYLKTKWKSHIRFEAAKSQELTKIDVERRQTGYL
jgi:hypothetical protein